MPVDVDIEEHIEMVEVERTEFKFTCPVEKCGREIIGPTLKACKARAGQHMEHAHGA